MNLWQIAISSLRYHGRVNLAIALGVAAATAVLTGALIIGDSMRGSLRDLTLDRLGQVDTIITSPDFFGEELAGKLASHPDFQSTFRSATPIIFFPNGSAEFQQDGRPKSVGQVNVQGIPAGYWNLGDERVAGTVVPGRGEVVINQVLADDLGITASQVASAAARITVGVPKQKLLPSDSSLGNKDDLVERLVDLTVVQIVPAVNLGRFGLHPTQVPPRNAWVAIDELQSALNEGVLKFKSSSRQANLILIAGSPAAPTTHSLTQMLQPNLEDLGLSLKRVTQTFGDQTIFDYFSLSSDRLVIPDQIAHSIREEFPDSNELFVYLANNIAPVERAGQKSGIPFSIVASVDPDSAWPLPSAGGGSLSTPGPDEIALTRWAADDQQLNIGDRVAISFFEPETTHGQETETTVELTVSGIIPLTTPVEPFRVGRRGRIDPAVFDQRPTTANDPDITPEVPGLTDAESIERWDLPFATADKIRPQDDEYWDYFRTTPKAWVALETGRRLWSSRFGETTSFRMAPGELTESEISQRLIQRFRSDGHLGGLQIVPIRRNGLAASAGSTPFDALFLGLSMFVIAAALVLVSLLFRLALQKRSAEMGTLLAFGFRQRRVGRLWLMEMLGVCLGGAVLGLFAAVGYAELMLWGLRTWWVGAITTPFLTLHISWWTLPLGLLLGVLICVVTILGSVRAARRQTVRSLLSGDLESGSGKPPRFGDWFFRLVIGICLVAATGLACLAAFRLAGESQAGAFMTAGFLILVAALVGTWRYLKASGARQRSGALSLRQLATTGAARNPLRSTLTIGLVAVASFLILAISAFRLSPTRQGTAGFNYVATTSQPVFADLNTATGQRQILRGDNQQLADASRVLSMRYKSGEDASCNNLYQSTQPQVLGVPPNMVGYFDDSDVDRFSFTMTPGENPWQLLQQPSDNGSIPVIIDKNTAWYSLKVYLPGSEFTVDYDSGEKITFRLVGLLSNSVLQGNLLISEDHFTRVFPDLSGYRYFLMKLADGSGSASEINRLAAALSDSGFDARSANRLLEGFLAVQNTYLSTFQSLGLLGLLLGTLGLAAVQLRSVMERRGELGLLQAVGFTRRQLARLIAIENAWLLLAGLAIGIGAALVTTLPHYFLGDASVPWLELLGMFAFIAVVGLVTSWLASRSVFRAPLIESLRAG